MKKEKIIKLFSGFCCSDCKNDFDANSINILREEENLVVIQIICSNCKKSFGIALLGSNSIEEKNDTEFEIQDCPLPINYDDVIDAHKFIDKLEKDWTKYIPEDLK